MKKKLILIFCLILLILINVNSSFAIWVIDLTNQNTNTNQNLDQNNIFWNIWKLNIKKSDLRQLESLIEIDKKQIEDKTKIISDLNIYYSEAYRLLKIINYSTWETNELRKDFLSKYTKILESLWQKADNNFDLYKESILNENTQNKIKKFIEVSEDEIKKYKEEIKNNNKLSVGYSEEIVKLEAILQDQIEQLTYKIFIFISIIIIWLLIKKIISNIINKSEKLSNERKNVLLSINKIFINISLVLSIFVFFSSEFFTILPFLAILGTAIWFALRDILSSFIAWFVIWLRDSIYKVDDMIEIKDDDIYWKVIEIKLLTTIIQEFWLSWPTWKILYFPNKRIFEKPITNLRKTQWFLFERIDFYLTQESNLIKAKEILQKVMDDIYISDIWRNIKNKKWFAKKYWLSEKSISPFIVVNIKREWVLLRWKTLFNFATSIWARTIIVEKFINQIQKEDDIKLINLVL